MILMEFILLYHMNHKSWISLALDDTLSDSLIMELVSKSYNLTKEKTQIMRLLYFLANWLMIKLAIKMIRLI